MNKWKSRVSADYLLLTQVVHLFAETTGVGPLLYSIQDRGDGSVGEHSCF